jgi:hypothetical protein
MGGIAAILKAIRTNEDIAAARQKVIKVMEKFKCSRLTKATEFVETSA